MIGNGLKKMFMAGLTVCAAAGFGMMVPAAVPSDLWQYSQYTDDQNRVIYEFKEVEVTLPADWNGKYGIQMGEDYIEFFHRASRKAIQDVGWGDGGGSLFGICYSQDYEFTQYEPNYYIVGSGAEGVYYITLPTDVQGYMDDADIWNEWQEIADDVEWVKDNVTVTVPGEWNIDADTLADLNQMSFTDGEYILADSSSRYLEAWELQNMSADELQMAINEIYARHHRKFVMTSIQEYFDSKSWYSGTVEAADFDVSVMNQYESANIMLMLQCMNSADRTVTVSSDPAAAVVTVKYTTADMNIRSGPSSDTRVMGVAAKGSAVTVTGSTVNGWVPVKYGQYQGYIYQDYLR